MKYNGWNPVIKCHKCSGIARMEFLSTIDGEGANIVFNKYKDVTGFGYDDHGDLVALDTKGNRIDPKDTRYNLEDDEYGWKTTGHKVKGFQKR